MNNASAEWEPNEPVVLYEDSGVLVVNKPAGLIVHSDGRTKEPSVVEWILEKYPALKDVGEPWTSPQGEVVPRPGIVHRLDRTTSGVMIVAKTPEAHEFLKQQFQGRTIEKVYDAIVYGHPKEDSGVIEMEIGRTKTDPRRWSAQYGKKGKLRVAITEWNVLARGVDPETGEKITHIEVRPKTGRTHQIRVHLKAIHHPIVCDHLYAEGRVCFLGFTRPALHARSLTLTLPSGEKKTFTAPTPPEFSKLQQNAAS
ncbi:RluA family pseudouridine synthase [Candidatus Kaiserbacteria bacterium]|nr:RluA family pseudouridine synthase [Candidatus Kaiserbacteria bacterium]